MLEVEVVVQIQREATVVWVAVVPVSAYTNKWRRRMPPLQTQVAEEVVDPVEQRVRVHPVDRAS